MLWGEVVLLCPEVQRPRVVVVNDVRPMQHPGQDVGCRVLGVGVTCREDDVHRFAEMNPDPVKNVRGEQRRVGLREYFLAELLVGGEIGLGKAGVQPRHCPDVLDQVLPRHVDLDDSHPRVHRADQVLADVAREGAPERPVCRQHSDVHSAAGQVVGPGPDPIDAATAGRRELHPEQKHVGPMGTHAGTSSGAWGT